MNQIIPYSKYLKPYIRDLRNNMTQAEKVLWRRIRCRSIYGVQFCRQMPVGTFILDFYSKNPKIAIEVDGPIHLSAQAITYDQNRDYFLTSQGIVVLRFTNDEVLYQINSVLHRIRKAILKNRPL